MDNLKQLNYLYDEMLENVEKVASLLDVKDFVKILDVISQREHILSNIRALQLSWQKPLPDELRYKADCIKEIEQGNIQRLEKLRSDYAVDLEKTKQKETLLKKYSGVIKSTGEILDIKE